MKLLSVIIPSYNMEQYLPKCLGSLVVAPELMEKLEVIVVNDGSKDRTSGIAHEYAAKWPGTFRVIDKENGHYGSCINAALPEAQGKYVKVLDADDYVATDAFEKVLFELGKINSDLVVTNYCHVNPSGVIVSDEGRSKLIEGKEFPVEELGLDVSFLSVHAIFYRRTIFNGWNYHQLEGLPYTDCQWVSEPMLRVKTVRFFPMVVTCYLVGRDGQSTAPACRTRDMGPQIAVDMYLAALHAKGQPVWSTLGAWRYLERLLCREVAFMYRMAFFGEMGLSAKLEIGRRLDSEFKSVDPKGWEAVLRCPGAYVQFGRFIRINVVEIWRRPKIATGMIICVICFLRLVKSKAEGLVFRSR